MQSLTLDYLLEHLFHHDHPSRPGRQDKHQKQLEKQATIHLTMPVKYQTRYWIKRLPPVVLTHFPKITAADIHGFVGQFIRQINLLDAIQAEIKQRSSAAGINNIVEFKENQKHDAQGLKNIHSFCHYQNGKYAAKGQDIYKPSEVVAYIDLPQTRHKRKQCRKKRRLSSWILKSWPGTALPGSPMPGHHLPGIAE